MPRVTQGVGSTASPRSQVSCPWPGAASLAPHCPLLTWVDGRSEWEERPPAPGAGFLHTCLPQPGSVWRGGALGGEGIKWRWVWADGLPLAERGRTLPEQCPVPEQVLPPRYRPEPGPLRTQGQREQRVLRLCECRVPGRGGGGEDSSEAEGPRGLGGGRGIREGAPSGHGTLRR